MRVLVKDLIDLKPGVILKMKAPVQKPGRITVEDAEILRHCRFATEAEGSANLTSVTGTGCEEGLV